MEANQTTQSHMYLFGGSKPWRSTDWTSSDDRIRGGSSISHLLIFPSSPSSPYSPSSSSSSSSSYAIFTGTLDTRTLGGAGFASQRTTADDLRLDLHAYTRGIELDIAPGWAVAEDGENMKKEKDMKKKMMYTLVLKDEVPPQPFLGERAGGIPGGGGDREQSTVSWEAEFRPTDVGEPEEGEGEKVLLRWEDFKAMYRGRERRDAGELRRGDVKRISIMCRSFFGGQEGDFELVIRSIAAVKEEADARYRDDPDDRRSSTEGEGSEKRNSAVVLARQGWWSWMVGACVKL